MNEIKNIVFDYGGVIANVYAEPVRRAFSDLGISKETQTLHEDIIGRLMNDYIDGVRPTDEVIAEMHGFCGEGVTLEDLGKVLSMLDGDLVASRVEKIVGLKPRYRVFLLSNICGPIWKNCVAQFHAAGYRPEECFERLFLSYEMGKAKPGREIYEEMIAETGIVPGETLYFDDRADNIETGRLMGLRASIVETNNIEKNPDYKALLENI